MSATNQRGEIAMPFTPFHMGAAMLVKPAAGARFSVIAFGLAQVVIDIEPGIGMLGGSDVLHGPSHTIIGAILIAIAVALVSPCLASRIVRRWNQEVRYHKLEWLVEVEQVSKLAVLAGAFFGTLSHLILDSLMHHDIHPLAPFSNANPLLGLVSHDAVYQLCVVMCVFGTAAWVLLKWLQRDAVGA
jgi:hypothetical protein